MKSILISLVTFLVAAINPHLAAIDESTQTPSTKEIQQNQDQKSQQKPPSINPEEPVFPLEDFMETPNKQNDRFFTEFLNMLATLGFVIGIILLAAWFLRRLLNTRLEQINTTSTIKIIERRSLSPKTALYLIEIYEKTVLIAESQNGVTQLAEFADNKEEPATTSGTLPQSFSKILEKEKERP